MPCVRSATFAFVSFCSKPHGDYLGETVFDTPSGGRLTMSAYRGDNYTVNFEPATLEDAQAFGPGALWREVQIAMREALRTSCPELFFEEDEP
jgi:hypothetical protein